MEGSSANNAAGNANAGANNQSANTGGVNTAQKNNIAEANNAQQNEQKNTQSAENKNNAQTPETKNDTQKSEDQSNDQKKQITDWREKVKNYYKDREFNSDDDLNVATSELLDDLIDYKTKGQEASEKLVSIFESEPAVADFMADLLNGASLPVALARNIDIDSIKPFEGDPDYAEWEKSKNERLEKIKKQKAFDDELAKNKAESVKIFNKFKEEKGLDDKQTEEFLSKVDTILADVYRGKVTSDFLNMMYKATGYEADIEKARKEGELKAKNEKIELQSKQYKNKKDDGLPEINSVSQPTEKPTVKKPRFLEALEKIEERQRNRI